MIRGNFSNFLLEEGIANYLNIERKGSKKIEKQWSRGINIDTRTREYRANSRCTGRQFNPLK